MNRAAISIASNIAEGISRKGRKEQMRFLNISYASLMELICQMEISKDIGYINDETYGDFIEKAQILSDKLKNLVKYIKKEIDSDTDGDRNQETGN